MEGIIGTIIVIVLSLIAKGVESAAKKKEKDERQQDAFIDSVLNNRDHHLDRPTLDVRKPMHLHIHKPEPLPLPEEGQRVTPIEIPTPEPKPLDDDNDTTRRREHFRRWRQAVIDTELLTRKF